MEGVFTAGHVGSADPQPMAPPAPQAVRDRRAACVLRRHQHPGRPPRSPSWAPGPASAGLCGARGRCLGDAGAGGHRTAVVADAVGGGHAGPSLPARLQYPANRRPDAALAPWRRCGGRRCTGAPGAARHPGATRQPAASGPDRARLPPRHRRGDAGDHHRQCLFPAGSAPSQGADPRGATRRDGAPAAAGAVRVLHAVPCRAPDLWRLARGRHRDP